MQNVLVVTTAIARYDAARSQEVDWNTFIGNVTMDGASGVRARLSPSKLLRTSDSEIQQQR